MIKDQGINNFSLKCNLCNSEDTEIIQVTNWRGAGNIYFICKSCKNEEELSKNYLEPMVY